MKCATVKIGDSVAIVCGSPRKNVKCGECRTRSATQLCDWKMPSGGTCDKPLCRYCSYPPASGKDLCSQHVESFKVWLAKRPPKGAKEPAK